MNWVIWHQWRLAYGPGFQLPLSQNSIRFHKTSIPGGVTPTPFFHSRRYYSGNYSEWITALRHSSAIIYTIYPELFMAVFYCLNGLTWMYSNKVSKLVGGFGNSFILCNIIHDHLVEMFPMFYTCFIHHLQFESKHKC